MLPSLLLIHCVGLLRRITQLSGHFQRLTANVNPLHMQAGVLATVNAHSHSIHRQYMKLALHGTQILATS
jgi:hypothetical protein